MVTSLSARYRRAISCHTNCRKEDDMKRVFLLAALMLVQGAQLRAQTPYYQGKTINFIVGSGAGTAYDIYSRLLANHIGAPIPGNPTVIMQNMPAAGGIVAANYVYAVAKPDG